MADAGPRAAKEVRVLRRALRYLLIGLLLGVGAGLLASAWILQRSLPQLDGTASLPELKQEVTVDRDTWGVPRIRAGSLEDLLTAQGYVLAQDRLWQMDVLRRAAAGELSEVFGPATLAMDRENRILGLRVAAEREAAGLDPEARKILEAYALGVNRYIQATRGKLPWEFVALRYQPRPWTTADSLLVGAYMYKTLTATWHSELDRAKVAERVGPERAADLFVADSPLDHFIVGEVPQAAPRLTPARKAARANPGPKAQNPRARLAVRSLAGAGDSTPHRDRGEATEIEKILELFGQEVRAGVGSNNWVVDGTHTASGKPLLANDTHLPLGAPCFWYLVHLTAPGWNVKGFTLPGVPLVVIGQNERIAWGFTNSGADVQDLYVESFNPANALEYRVNGRWVAATLRRETIRVKGRPDETLDVVVTRHGPIIHRGAGKAYALRWTATEPGGLALAIPMLGRARNWDEFRETCRRIPGPAQNAVYADVDGNIGFIVAARIPVRKCGPSAQSAAPDSRPTACGAVPLPGDTGDYEWTGYIPFEELPQVLNPRGGVIATANARVAGPGYPHYLTDRWISPYRTARIYERLGEGKKFTPVDFIAIQTDIVSLPHRFLAEQLLRAAASAQPRDPRARALVGQLKQWDGSAAANSVEMAFVEYTRRALMRGLLQPHLGDERSLYDWWRSGVFLENVLRDRPARWLPPNFTSYNALLMDSADAAVRQLDAESHHADLSRWQWGQFIRLEIAHPLGRSAWLAPLLGVGPLAQAGAPNTVKQTGRSFGPAMRFVADLSNPDNSLMNLTLGESGQWASPHYRDQFPAWFEGRGLPAPFSDAGVEKARAHRLRLAPGAGSSSGRP